MNIVEACDFRKVTILSKMMAFLSTILFSYSYRV